MVDLLLSHGVRLPDKLDERTSSTALIIAASHGHVTLLMTLIHRGKANPKQTDLRGRTALHWAAMSDSPEACAFLLEAGCPVDAVDYLGCTALHCAAFSSAECALVFMKKIGINVQDRYGFTPLHWACLGRNSVSVKYLLGAGAKVNALGKSKDRQTPLDCALRRNATEAAELLIAAGGMTAHGYRKFAAIKIQALWRAYKVRKTVKVLKKHEKFLNDEKVEAIYYGMGKSSIE